MNIDYKAVSIFLSNREFRKFFIERFLEIIKGSDSCDASAIGRLCKENKEIRKIVFDNLDLVFSKMNDIGYFSEYMNTDELHKNKELFFKYGKITPSIRLLFTAI